jgi:hypothetical protein
VFLLDDCLMRLNFLPADEPLRPFFLAAEVLPLCSSELLAAFRADPRAPFLLLFFRYRFAARPFHFFLEGVPKSVGTHPVPWLASSVQKPRLTRDHVLADRHALASELARAEVESSLRLEDAPPGLRGCAHEFVNSLRITQRLLANVKGASLFAACENAACHRSFYVGGPVEWPKQPPRDGEAGYWEALAGKRRAKQVLFCCSSCASEHSREMKRLLPDIRLTHVGGTTTVSKSLQAALKRNGAFGRELRTARDSPRVAVSDLSLEIERRARVTALNVDVGLLFAAKLLAEERAARALPGKSDDWRSKPALYMRAAAKVGETFERFGHKDTPISETFSESKFLDVVRARAGKIF